MYKELWKSVINQLFSVKVMKVPFETETFKTRVTYPDAFLTRFIIRE